MCSSVVLIPGAPVLVPELSGAAAAESVGPTRQVVEMLGAAAVGATEVRVWGTDTVGRDGGDVRSSLVRWGVDVAVGRPSSPIDGDLPDAALVAWWFLDRAGVDLPRSFHAAGLNGRPSSVGGSDALLVVVGDGPASLSARAPVPEDPCGVAFDARLSSWLTVGGPLPDPGGTVAEEIGWWSRSAWLALSEAVGVRPAMSAVSWAPFGVGYHAARWELGPSLDDGSQGGEA